MCGPTEERLQHAKTVITGGKMSFVTGLSLFSSVLQADVLSLNPNSMPRLSGWRGTTLEGLPSSSETPLIPARRVPLSNFAVVVSSIVGFVLRDGVM